MDLSGAGDQTGALTRSFDMPVRQLLLISVLFVAIGCGGGGSSSDSFFARDETAEAAVLVETANKKLKLIKKRFKDNEPRYDDLKNALKAKDVTKVRMLSNEFVEQIAAGIDEGNNAIADLRNAREMKINGDFRDYLEMKISSLEKYVDAFEQRKEAAKILADGYDPKDAAKRERVIAEFREKEEKFNEIIEEGRRHSQDANDLARESMKKKN